jgi:hypothetical protein
MEDTTVLLKGFDFKLTSDEGLIRTPIVIRNATFFPFLEEHGVYGIFNFEIQKKGKIAEAKGIFDTARVSSIDLFNRVYRDKPKRLSIDASVIGRPSGEAVSVYACRVWVDGSASDKQVENRVLAALIGRVRSDKKATMERLDSCLSILHNAEHFNEKPFAPLAEVEQEYPLQKP